MQEDCTGRLVENVSSRVTVPGLIPVWEITLVNLEAE